MDEDVVKYIYKNGGANCNLCQLEKYCCKRGAVSSCEYYAPEKNDNKKEDCKGRGDK